MSNMYNIKMDDIVICMIDEWGEGKKSAFDCNITSMNEKGIDTLYLSGYRSRNDFVEWADVVAVVDLSEPQIDVADGTFAGHFRLLHEVNEKGDSE